MAVVLCTLAITAQAEPGQLITIESTCVYSPSPGQPPVTETSQTTIVVMSPLHLDRPVYLCQGWRRTDVLTGAGGGLVNKLAAGLLVRAFVWMDGQPKLADGIQLLDGRVWINNQAYDRADSPS